MSENVGIQWSFGGGGERHRDRPVQTELQALLIDETPRRNYRDYMRENRRRRLAKLPLGDVTRLVADDEQVWTLEMAKLGSATVEEALAAMPMPIEQFQALQGIADNWEMGELIPHLWGGKWFCSTPFSEVPRFRFPLDLIIRYPNRADDVVLDFQRAMASIGLTPAQTHPDHGDSKYSMKDRIAKGKAARSEGIYARNGYIHNAGLRKGQIGYPVVLDPIE